MLTNRGSYYLGKPVAESVGARWQLAGIVELVRKWDPGWFARHQSPLCLRLTRKSDALSWSIEFAMNSGWLLPKVEITTPSGVVTLLNARVVGGRSTPPHSGSGSGSSKHTQEFDTNEFEVVELTFQKIEFKGKRGGATAQDDWNAPS